ncbi:putative lipoprotein [Leptospira ellinghausenii]|uniref:Putative lipoprotein n=1 Tax=Leptospira ellinghausenii TaxID=1917822 RepID=A0A2P2DA80_9LEPT|nr:putative lipoprotein [Leptospira ellinghausenii]
MKFLFSSIAIFSLQNCVYNLNHIDRIEKTEKNWIVEEKNQEKQNEVTSNN